MSESKLTASHLRRSAVVYVRQSTLAQIAATGSPPPASTTRSRGRWSWAGHPPRSG